MEKLFFKIFIFGALYFLGFGAASEVFNLLDAPNPELSELVSRVVGFLLGSFVLLSGTVTENDVEEKTTPRNKDKAKENYYSNDKKYVVFNSSTFNKWIRIHFPEEYKGTGEHYVTHARMEELAKKYYEEFEFIIDGGTFAIVEGPSHSQFIFDIKSSWMNTSTRTV